MWCIRSRAVVHQRLDLAEIRRRGHLPPAYSRPASTGYRKNQSAARGRSALADAAHRVQHIAQAVGGVRGRPAPGWRLLASVSGHSNFGPSAFGKVQPQAHGVRHGEDVGKQNRPSSGKRSSGCRVTSVPASVGAQAMKLPAAAGFPAVLRQVAAGLAHHPDRVCKTGSRNTRQEGRSFAVAVMAAQQVRIMPGLYAAAPGRRGVKHTFYPQVMRFHVVCLTQGRLMPSACPADAVCVKRACAQRPCGGGMTHKPQWRKRSGQDARQQLAARRHTPHQAYRQPFFREFSLC